MKYVCTNKNCQSSQIHKHSFYYRKSDRRKINRYKCYECGKTFSSASFAATYKQKKRHLNFPIYKELCSGVCINQIAKKLNTSHNTVLRKLVFLGEMMRSKNKILLDKIQRTSGSTQVFQFDEMHSFVHTKCKPYSIVIALDKVNQHVLGVETSKTSVSSKLSKIAKEKYGHWPNEERKGLESLLNSITPYLSDKILIESDQKQSYLPLISKHFKNIDINYDIIQYKGRKATSYGMGELKTGEFYNSKSKIMNCIIGENNEPIIVNGKIKSIKHNRYFDPLFDINHTFALFRARISRLIKQTWCTTKKIENLRHHLEIFIYMHNSIILEKMIAKA